MWADFCYSLEAGCNDKKGESLGHCVCLLCVSVDYTVLLTEKEHFATEGYQGEFSET